MDGNRYGDSPGITGLLKDIYENRSILASLVQKNLFGRYRDSRLGFVWHVLTPLVMILVYYVVFTGMRTSDLKDFWVYLAVAIVPFNFMLTNLSAGSKCVTSNAQLVNKIYFPREILALAQVIGTFITMAIAYTAICTLILISGFRFEPTALLYLLPVMFLMAVFVTGMVMLLSSISVYVRDLQHAISSVEIMFYFVTPLYFVIDRIEEPFRTLLWYNPFTYFTESFHDIMYWGTAPDTHVLLVCLTMSVVSFIVGATAFHRLKDGFAERL